MGDTESSMALALQALAYLLQDEGMSGAFMAQAGLSPDDLRARVGDPDLLAAVLDFLLSDDGLVLGFATAAGLPPEAVLTARAALPGGDLPHWT